MSLAGERLQGKSSDSRQRDEHTDESVKTASKLNWLRAGVLGANDGIVSTAGVVVGVAAADPQNNIAIFTAGMAAVVAGAISMAAGEYVSVSTQKDTEQALVHKEKTRLKKDPEGEFESAGTAESAGTEATGVEHAGIKAASAAGDQVVADPSTGEILEEEAKNTRGSNPPASSEAAGAENVLDPEGEYILENTFSGEAA